MNPYDPNTPAGPPPAVSRKRHHYIRWILAGLGSLILLIVILGIVTPTAAQRSGITVPAPSPSSSTSAPATQASVPAAVASSSSPVTTGSVGTTFTVTSSDGTSYDVTMTAVRQNVYPGAYETPQTAGDHFAAVQFTVKGDSGSTADDANSDAAAIGSDGQQYSPAFNFDSLPNFSSGEFHISPGVSVSGWVAFELPPGVTVASVQWAPSLDGSAATWTT